VVASIAGSERRLLGIELPVDDDLLMRVRASVGARLFGLQPRDVGRYALLAELGRGGAGTVYRAFDPVLDRHVALKLLHGAVPTPAGRARLVREARVLAGLHHPNIVEVFDVGIADGRVYIVTELVEGGDLASWLARQRDVASILSVFAAAGRGLAGAHARGVVHRDFKPSNVLLTPGGVAKVADFGLAKQNHADSLPEVERSPPLWTPSDPDATTLRTRTGVVLGTAPYMAPEQHQGLEADERTDIYAFCVSLYEALHGQRPFAGRTLGELEAAKTAPAIHRGPEIPPWLSAVIDRGLQPDPGERWSSMDDVLRHLERPRRWPELVTAAAVFVAVVAFATQTSETRSCENATTRPFAATLDAVRAELGPGSEALEPLDAAARDWTDAWDESCRYDETEGRAALFDARSACLRRSANTLEAIARTLPRADARRRARAIVALDRLPSPRRCLDPDGEEQRGEASDADLAIARARLLLDLGDYVEARDAARDALALAGEGPDLPAAVFWYGKLTADLSQYHVAAEELERAHWLAAAAADDVLTARSAIELFRVHALGLGQLAAAETWRRHASTALGRADVPAEVTTRYHVVAAAVEFTTGDAEASLREADAAVRAARAIADPSSPIAAQAGRARGEALFRLGRYDEALEVLAARLEADEAAFGTEHPETVMTLGWVGIVLTQVGRKEEAVSVLRQAADRADAAYAPTSRQRVATRQMLAEVLHQADRNAEAAEVLEEALSLVPAGDGSDPHFLTILHVTLGIVRAHLGQFDEAERVLNRALTHAQETLGVRHVETAFVMEGLAQLERERRRPAEAATLYEAAAEIFGERGSAAEHWRETCRVNAAETWLQAGEHARAEASFRSLLEQPPADPAREGRWSAGLGASLRGLGRADEAVPHLERGLQLLDDSASSADKAWVRDELAAARTAAASTRVGPGRPKRPAP
jgi:tetratricopeptide (TPR) repeat protein